mmetsp:Transcript_81981/g.244526  ORF Transcript_81981/g.244526 Transcript_81981/m.244526 type:complete len:248 (-) Transcript_81981:690-1433(-)
MRSSHGAGQCTPRARHSVQSARGAPRRPSQAAAGRRAGRSRVPLPPPLPRPRPPLHPRRCRGTRQSPCARQAQRWMPPPAPPCRAAALRRPWCHRLPAPSQPPRGARQRPGACPRGAARPPRRPPAPRASSAAGSPRGSRLAPRSPAGLRAAWPSGAPAARTGGTSPPQTPGSRSHRNRRCSPARRRPGAAWKRAPRCSLHDWPPPARDPRGRPRRRPDARAAGPHASRSGALSSRRPGARHGHGAP